MTQVNDPSDKVRALQQALYTAAKRNPKRRFPALYDRMSRPDILRRAWEQVRQNRGAAGVDGETIAAIEAYGVERMLAELRARLEAKRYRPAAVRRVLWEEEAGHLGKLIRYSDDFVVLCRTGAQAQAALVWLQATLERLKLRLHPEKTRVVDLGQGAAGFDFLGFHIRRVASWRYRGRSFCQRWPSRRALMAVRARVRAVIGPRSQLSRDLAEVVGRLNPALRGWGNYFRWGNSSRKFVQIDSYVHERLALFDSKKRGRSGRGWGTRHNAAWLQSLGVYRLSGTVQYGSPATASG
jgi:Group II intron, maturase-specific domain/Reverse transcriptase (RNA-dependent DNA polymerase)